MIVKIGAPGATEVFVTSEVRDIETRPVDVTFKDPGWSIHGATLFMCGMPYSFHMGDVGAAGTEPGTMQALAVKVRRENGEVNYLITNLPVWLMNNKGDTIERYN